MSESEQLALTSIELPLPKDSTPKAVPRQSNPAPLPYSNTENPPASAPSLVSEEKPKSYQQWTALSLWHELILHMDRLNQPILKGYLQEGKPESLSHERLIVSYDPEFDPLHIEKIKREIRILNQCLHSITGNRNLSVEINLAYNSPPAPDQMEKSREIPDVRNRLEKNPFVASVIREFEGRIVEIRG